MSFHLQVEGVTISISAIKHSKYMPSIVLMCKPNHEYSKSLNIPFNDVRRLPKLPSPNLK